MRNAGMCSGDMVHFRAKSAPSDWALSYRHMLEVAMVAPSASYSFGGSTLFERRQDRAGPG
jgi:hypothetical protein